MTDAIPMKNDIDAIVDDLLSRWHSWRSGYTHERGYRGRDATSRDAQSQWTFHDRTNGVYDDHIEAEIMRGVDRAVERIPDQPEPLHLVILIEARNLWSGAAVWNSIRLPLGEELDILRIRARSRLLIELQREGCIGG